MMIFKSKFQAMEIVGAVNGDVIMATAYNPALNAIDKETVLTEVMKKIVRVSQNLKENAKNRTNHQ